ncbi:MAG TPA: hypothetical protein VGR69_08575 [Candidatus Rubrimentiphilum sp.]|nr:hypothetical protein [Candidatus Rubrimentiphilum sp.]
MASVENEAPCVSLSETTLEVKFAGGVADGGAAKVVVVVVLFVLVGRTDKTIPTTDNNPVTIEI